VEGKAKISAANTWHGSFTNEAKEKRKVELRAKRQASAMRRAELEHLHRETMCLKRELALVRQSVPPASRTG
jgi:hypothetical protein